MQERRALSNGGIPRLVPVPSGAGGTWQARTNVLPRLTSFVGRTHEVTALCDRIAETRLLTLTGIGGVGKSRLAIEVTRATFERRFGEAWLVELAAVSDPADVPSTVASVLGVHDSGGAPVLGALATALADRQLLLVLDNCEHLAEAVGDLVLDLLGRCPRIHVLATSRVQLDVHGETNWRVDPLPVPDLERLPGRMSLSRTPVVRLFVERARAARADFTLTEQNLGDVARICAGLDGLPLAIELAAARVSLLSPKQIADRLVDCFSLLARSGRGAPPHQRTLRAALDWSYELLSEAEQTMFRRLAVFVGGFTLDAVEVVARGAGRGTSDPDAVGAQCIAPTLGPSSLAPRPSPLETLAGLVAKSLVLAEERDDEARYRQLETVRQYGWERLQEAGELEAGRRWHRDWLLAKAEANERRSWGHEQVAAIDWFAVELDNLRAAIDWCEIEGAGELGLRLGASLGRFWEASGRLVEGRERLARLLALAGPDADARARGMALWFTSTLAFWAGDTAASSEGWRESLRLGRAAADPVLIGGALGVLALVEQLEGHGAAADAMLASALAEPPMADNPNARLALLYYRGYLAVNRGDLVLGDRVLEEGVAFGRLTGDLFTLAHCAGTLGHAAMLRGDLDRACRFLVEALVIRQQLKNSATIAFTIEKLGWLAATAGDARGSARRLGAAAAIRSRAGAQLYPYEIDGHRQAEATARQALGDGPFEAAYAEGLAMSIDQAIEQCRGRDLPRTAPNGRVSPRTRQIARLVAQGLTNRQIADELVIQESTVASHLRQIYDRFDLAGRAQLASWAFEHGLTGDAPS
jgi:predicted ATPase/DNA-binding CsgD family transcriptional regulator